MRNELLLIGSVILIYSVVIISYKLFGKNGLFAMTSVATVLANVEVLMLVEAFGITQTLGNVMFASTFLITDILSENEGKKSASKAVWIGVFTSIVMLMFTQYWMLYTPSSEDWARDAISQIFSTTPRLVLASFTGYVISQRLDVWLYHAWWNFTEKKCGDKKRFLWIRNNFSTLISQVVNTVIFTLIAFGGWYETKTMLTVMLSSYIVYVFTSILDTPCVYLARLMKEKGMIK